MNETLYRWVFVLFVAVVVPTTSGEEDGAGSGSPGALRVGSDKSKQQKALVVPSHLESVVDVWSAPFELEFIPKHEVTIELTGGGGDISFAPKELVFDGTEPFRKTFRIKGRKTGYFHIHYEFKNSKHPFPFAGMKQSLVYILDKAQVSVVQPSSGTLTVGLTSEPHKISLTRPSNLKVVPKAKGIVFEPREILFSRQGPQVLGFRAKVSENAGQGDDADKHKFSVLVSLELQCPGKEDDLDTCDRDGFYEPADFRWEINNVNKLEVKEKIVVTNKEVFDLPISFRFPQECRIEVFSNGLVLSKSVLQLSREDSSVTHYIKVMGRRDENVQRSCPSTDPCTYMVRYVVKDIHGRLITNFGTPPTYVTTVSIIDRAKIDLPGNETVAFLNQTLTLSLSWPEALQKEKLIQLQDDEQQRGKNGALFEVHIEGDDSDAVTIEPNVIQFKSQEDRLKQYPFNVTLHKEGLHTISFRLTGPRANLVQLLENSISITAYESFYEDNFSFSEKYGIGGLDSQLNEIMRRALISRVVSNEAIDALGVSHVKGILLHGPPGCGKTMVARQIGSMLQTHPPKVVNGPEIISKYLGESENKIRSLFADAEADHQGNNNNRKMHLIVFDEIDALVRPRGRGQGEAADQVYDGITNQLLSKMDGIEKLDNVLVVGTTNRKDLIDPALLRPGRFDVILEVNLPDREGRLQIFRIHTKKLYQNDLMGEDVDLEKLAKLTNTFTGAEIEAVVKAASSLAMEDMLKVTNSANIRSNQFSVKMDHFLKAMKDIEPANVDSHEMLDKLDDYGRLLVYNEQVESAINRFKNAVNYVVDHQEEGKRVMSILVHGDAGTGKTGFVANIMKDFNFSRLKIISAESLIMESRSSIERKILIIQDAFKSVSSSKHLCSALILDDLDGILEHVDTQAGQYVNSPMLSQLRILMRKPSQGSFVLVATASTSSIMKFNQLVDTFDLVIELPKVKSVGETRRILQDIEVNAEVKEHVIMPLVEEHLPIPIKKLLKFIDLAQSNADLIPEPPLARVIGDTADEPPPMMIDMVANNKTSMKIFLM